MGRNIARGIRRRQARQEEAKKSHMLRRVDLQGILTNNKMAQDELEAMGESVEDMLELALKNCGPQKRRLILNGFKEKFRGAPRAHKHPNLKGVYVFVPEKRASLTPVRILDFINQYGKLSEEAK